MGLFEGIFLGGLIAVVLVQLFHRAAGAGLAVLWCVLAGAYGWWQISQGASVTFFGVGVRPYTFLAAMGAMALYNGWVLVRAVRRPR